MFNLVSRNNDYCSIIHNNYKNCLFHNITENGDVNDKYCQDIKNQYLQCKSLKFNKNETNKYKKDDTKNTKWFGL